MDDLMGDDFLADLGLDDEFATDLGLDTPTVPKALAYDLHAGLKEEAALNAWINRATARRNQVRSRNRAAMVRSGARTWTPEVDGVKIGTVTLKGSAREAVIEDQAAFTRWVRTNFPSEAAPSVDLGDIQDPEALVTWLIEHQAPIHPTVSYDVRSSFKAKILSTLTDTASTVMKWPADETTGELRELEVAGVKVIDVPETARVHQITFDKKRGGEDAAAAYLEARGLAALTPGAEAE